MPKYREQVTFDEMLMMSSRPTHLVG